MPEYPEIPLFTRKPCVMKDCGSLLWLGLGMNRYCPFVSHVLCELVEDKCWTHYCRQLPQYTSGTFFLFLLLIQQHTLPINHSITCLTGPHDYSRVDCLPTPDDLDTKHRLSGMAEFSWAMAARPELTSSSSGVSWD